MRTTKNVSITMPVAMVRETARLAKRENRTISELVREALRQYKTNSGRKHQDDLAQIASLLAEIKKKPMTEKDLRAEEKRLMEYGARQAKKLGIKERDVVRIIHESRASRRAS